MASGPALFCSPDCRRKAAHKPEPPEYEVGLRRALPWRCA
jgi:hypothetical protein